MRASGYDRVADDWYVEDERCVDDLLNVEQIDRGTSVWDPFCGCGNIPKALRRRGIDCFASDKVDRGFGAVGDFFDDSHCSGTAEVILTNPPYSDIERVIRHALALAEDRVIVLARLALLESVGREALFKETPFARMIVSRRRISMPPGGVDMPAKGGAIPYAWFVFQHGYDAEPVIRWI